MCKLGVISKERFKIQVKLLLSANRKLYMSRQMAQQQMTLSDLERPFHASRIISAVAELPIHLESHFSIFNAILKCEFDTQN